HSRRQRGDRWHHRLAGNPRPAENTAEPRSGDESGEDRRGVLLSARPGSVVRDARAATDAVFDPAEQLMARPRSRRSLASAESRPPNYQLRTLFARAVVA